MKTIQYTKGLIDFEFLQTCQLELQHQYVIQKKEKKKAKYAEFLKRKAESQHLNIKNIHGK